MGAVIVSLDAFKTARALTEPETPPHDTVHPDLTPGSPDLDEARRVPAEIIDLYPDDEDYPDEFEDGFGFGPSLDQDDATPALPMISDAVDTLSDACTSLGQNLSDVKEGCLSIGEHGKAMAAHASDLASITRELETRMAALFMQAEEISAALKD